MKKLSKRDKAALLGVDNSTLYNWRKHKPNLYRIVMLGFEFDALLEQMRQNADELERIDEKNQTRNSSLWRQNFGRTKGLALMNGV